MPCEPQIDLENDRPTQLTLPTSPTVISPTTSRGSEHDSDLDSDSSSESSSQYGQANNGFDPRVRTLSLPSKPPSYSTVFPDPNKIKTTEKINFLNKIKNHIKKTCNNTNNQTTTTEIENQQIATISGPTLNDPNMQQPITYDELYRNNNTQTNQNRLNNKLVKRFNRMFTHSYYLRHFVIVSLCSFSTISLQIILISNNALYSDWCSGIWTGLLNLLILLLSVYTCKYITYFN
jgi:hypothetical protein